MQETFNWQDLKLFMEVANAGGLAGAVAATGISAPTLGRHMLSLEQAAGLELFIRHRNGYDLTIAGKDLLSHARVMQKAYAGVERWQENADTTPIVKVSAGVWTSQFIASNSKHLLSKTMNIRLALTPDNNFVDIAKREAHLAIRNQRPSQNGLAIKKLGTVEFVVYGARNLQSIDRSKLELADLFTDFPWVAFEPRNGNTASTTWLSRHLTKPPQLSCSSPTPVLEAARGGTGLCVLPCFIGDSDPALARYSKPIDELSHTQWLVNHDEDRHLKHVKAIAKRITAVFNKRSRP